MNLFLFLAIRTYVIGFACWFLLLFATGDLDSTSFFPLCVLWPLTTPVIVIGGCFFHRKERRRHYLSRYRLGRREFRHVMNASIDDLVREQEERNAAEGIVV
jgi:hypothetical protein